MIRRTIHGLALAAGLAAPCLLTGCGGSGTGAATEAHDQDKSAGHMNHPAGGPNSPLAKKAARKAVAPAPAP